MGEERGSRRWRRVRRALGLTAAGETHGVRLAFVTQTGARGTTAAMLSVGDRIALRLPCVGDKAGIVEWVQEGGFGCRFLVPLRFQDLDRATVPEAVLTIHS